METSNFDNVEDVYPLTPMQQGMLFHALADPTASVFVNQMTIRLEGTLDEGALRSACESLVARHAVLRTAFLWDGLDKPLQVVREQVQLEWASHDLSSLDPDEQERHLGDFVARDRERGFDLAAAPLTRIAMIRLGSNSRMWVWTTHHLIADGWSMRVILDELFSDLRGELSGDPDPPFRFGDFVAFQASRDTAADEEYWRSHLSGFVSPHRLEVPGLEASASGHRAYSITIDSTTSAALRTFAREQRVTLNTVILGTWALVMSRWMRTRDVVFGVTTAGREASLPGVEDAVGLFINTLPARVDVAPTSTLGDWLRSVQKQQLDSRRFEQTSLASVQRWSQIPPGEPLFESIYVFENLPAADQHVSAEGFQIESTDFVEHSNYPLAVLVHPEDEIRIQFIYDRARLSAGAVEALGTQMKELTGHYPQRAEERLSRFGLTTEHDGRRLAAWESGPDPQADERLIHEIIADVAERSPHAIAAIFRDETISYGHLVDAATTVAARLRDVGVGPNHLVGLYVPRSIDMLIGMLGILQAGGAYVPLDPAYPEGHISMLLDNSGVQVVVTDKEHRDRVPTSVGIVSIDDDSSVPMTDSPPSLSADNIAYVIHTSGSTGIPKGVTVTHRNLVHSTLARDQYYRAPVGRFLLLSSFAFDSSVAGLFWTLCSGGALVLPDVGREHDADHLLALAADHRVTHMLCLPSLYQVLLDHDENRSFSDLEVAIVAGEAFPPELLESHFRKVLTTSLHNEYGPTEATVWCSAHQADESDIGRSLPIGRPIAGARIYLLDEYGNRVPPGFVGEICVAGAGLTPGYLNRPDLTAEMFLTIDLAGNPERLYRTGDLGCFNEVGELLYLGRADSQLKIRGHRIEPSAVESVLRAHRMVEEAAVAGRRTGHGPGMQLVAFVSGAGSDLDVPRLRAELREALPSFMVPDVIAPLESIPRLPNGKTDYSKLPDLSLTDLGSSQFVPPRSETETRMSALWADLLGLEQASVGADADYFALGGDSLLAIRLMSAVHREFGTTLPLSALLEAPALGDFCERLQVGSTESDLLVPIGGDGPETVFMIHPGGGNVLTYQPLARHLPKSIRTMGVQAYGIEGDHEPDRTVEEMARRYSAAIDEFLPTGLIHLVGHSTGGLVTYETARQLEQRGRGVGLVALLDTLYPLGTTLRARIARQMATVRLGGWRGVRTVAYWYWATLRGLAGKVRHGPKWLYRLWRGESLPAALAGKRVNHIALRAQRVYQPQSFPGTVTYVRATGDEDHRVQNSPDLWAQVAGNVEVRSAPGHHTGENSIVSESHAQATAAIIAEEMALLRP